MWTGVFLHPTTPNGNQNQFAYCNTLRIAGKTSAGPEGSFGELLHFAAPGQLYDNADHSAPLLATTDARVLDCLPGLETLPSDAAVRGGKRRVPALTLDDLCKLQTLPLRVAASRAQLSETQVRTPVQHLLWRPLCGSARLLPD